jgi:hypothetical protein
MAFRPTNPPFAHQGCRIIMETKEKSLALPLVLKTFLNTKYTKVTKGKRLKTRYSLVYFVPFVFDLFPNTGR